MKLIKPLGLLGILASALGIRAEPLAMKPLIEIATRHKLPMPPKEARLVLAHTEMWSVLGNQSTSRDPGIYSPAFLLEEKADGSIVVLRGTERQTLESRHGAEPLWRPFSTAHVEPKLGGHVGSFDRLSAFVCAVQSAARGEESIGQDIWQRFSSAEWWSDGQPMEGVEQAKNPELLLGRCLFDHLRSEALRRPVDWADIQARMKALLDEFPALKGPQRNQVFEALTSATAAKPPPPDSTEALLLDWARRPSSMRHLGLFHEEKESEADAPARAIIQRGASAVPDLIALLDDKRITTHEVSSFMKAPARIQTVGGLARRLLEEITGIQSSPHAFTTDPAPYRAWLEKQRGQGEENSLAESVFTRKGDEITGVNEAPARVLAQKYPQRLLVLCEEFSKHAAPNAQPFALAEALSTARLPKEDRMRALAGFAQRGSLEHKRCVLQNLAKVDDKKCAELLGPVLEGLDRDSDGPYWTCPEAAFTHVVMQVEDDDTWRKYLRAAKRSSVGLRMEMMNPLCYTYIGEKNRARRLAFAAAFLEDEAVRDMSVEKEKFEGPCAAFTIPRISVRDFAAKKLAAILRLTDHPDEFWTTAQWSELRKKVREKLASEKLSSLD